MIAKRQISAARTRRENGNSLLEFALMSVVLLMMTCGVADFSRLFTLANMAQGAAEAGVQYASLSPSHWNASSVQTAAVNDTGNYSGAVATWSEFWTCSIGGTQSSTVPTCDDSATPQRYEQVVVTIPYTSILKYPMIPDPVNISSYAVVRVE